jgi:hypothetical protein
MSVTSLCDLAETKLYKKGQCHDDGRIPHEFNATVAAGSSVGMPDTGAYFCLVRIHFLSLAGSGFHWDANSRKLTFELVQKSRSDHRVNSLSLPLVQKPPVRS